MFNGIPPNIDILTFVPAISLFAWLILLLARGGFWKSDQRLRLNDSSPISWPSIAAIVPARNEEESIAETISSLKNQNYLGRLEILIVDDNSEDGTAAQVKSLEDMRVRLLTGSPLQENWTGKLWALQQGLEKVLSSGRPPDYVLFTDADIQHPTNNLRNLVLKAETDGLHLVSLMVRLNCRSLWEVLLIPAFIFFFQKLYPFPWINDPSRSTAGAAGGCILLRTATLIEAGGLEKIKSQIIDDCALARLMKPYGAIWIGLSQDVISLREYPSLGGIWSMVIRTAYDQLNYSVAQLVGSVLGMIVLYLVPPGILAIGLVAGDILTAFIAGAAWTVMFWCYKPTLQLYGRNNFEALLLPIAALLYTIMTIDSAFRYWIGRAPKWKGRENTIEDKGTR